MAGLLLKPDAGTVMVDGGDALALDDDGRARLRRSRFGFVFQHTQLIGSLCAYENAAVSTRFVESGGTAGEPTDERARALLSDLGLAERLYHYPYQLSVGQKRRVAVARALLLDPPVIVADEPANDLDSDSARRVEEKLFAVVGRGKALVLVTHDRELAVKARRQYELVGGTLARKGTSRP